MEKNWIKNTSIVIPLTRKNYLNKIYNKRMNYFIRGMNYVYRIKNLQSIAIPETLGDVKRTQWEPYLKNLEKYEKKFPKVRLVLYCYKYWFKTLGKPKCVI